MLKRFVSAALIASAVAVPLAGSASAATWTPAPTGKVAVAPHGDYRTVLCRSIKARLGYTPRACYVPANFKALHHYTVVKHF